MAVRPITDTMRHIRGGEFLEEATNALGELVRAVDATGKAGKVTLEISVKKISRDANGVSGKVILRKPAEAAEETLMFTTPEGNLLTEHPQQQKMPFAQVVPVTQPLKQAGENNHGS